MTRLHALGMLARLLLPKLLIPVVILAGLAAILGVSAMAVAWEQSTTCDRVRAEGIPAKVTGSWFTAKCFVQPPGSTQWVPYDRWRVVAERAPW